jgi:hypothetical protein
MHDLSNNFVDNPEALLRKTRSKLKKVSPYVSKDIKVRSLTLVFEVMAGKTLHEFSIPTTTNIRTGPTVNVGEDRFELKPALINMVQANQFCGKAHEDASGHLQHFLEIVVLSPSKEFPRMPYYSVYFHFHS